jgi:ubiquinone biosynthesis protein COQ4
MDDIPYLYRGINLLKTDSSVLISSSRYLNNPAMREWMATELLRRNGLDVPSPSGAYKLSFIIKEIQDFAQIDRLFEQERKRWPELDRFLTERFVSTYTKEDLARLSPDSVGGLYHTQLHDNDYRIDIVPVYEPKGHYDYWLLRSGQVHDWEHIITHGGFDSLGEVTTGFARLENIYKHFSAELACELTVMQFLLSFRFISRMALHYPAVWHDMWAAADRGRRAGRSSDAYVLKRYEDVLHLTPAQARNVLGVREVDVTVDTSIPSRIWDGKLATAATRAPTEASR